MAREKWNEVSLPGAFEELNRLQDEVDRLFGLSFFPDTAGLFDRTVAPPVDVLESRDDVVVAADLPGMERNEISLTLAANVLTLKGEKRESKKNEKGKTYRDDTWSGNFQRTISLPNSVDPDKVVAELRDGVLRVKIGKKAEHKPRQIAVNIA